MVEKPNNSGLFSKKDVLNEMSKRGWSINYRTVDYYVRKGIIERPFRIPGKKEVFWEEKYIIKALLSIARYMRKFGFSLKQIKAQGKQATGV